MVEDSIDSSGPYAGSGQAGPFPITFRFLSNDDLQLIITTGGVEFVVPSSGWMAQGAGLDGNRFAYLTSPLPFGSTLTINREVPFTQETDYTQSDSFPAESHENALDKLTMLAQQLQRGVNQSLRIPERSGVLPTLPARASRANTFLAFDANGNPTVSVPASGSAADVLTQLSGAAGAGKVGFDPLAKYPAWTFGSVVQGWVSAATYGAKGDNFTDDTAALTAALATGKSLFLPDGTYLTGPLTCTAAGQEIFGPGRSTQLKPLNFTQPLLTMSGAHQRVSDIAFNGGSSTLNDANTSFCAVKITGSRCVVESVYVLGNWTRAVEFNNALYSSIDRSYIEGFRKRGISIIGGTFTTVSRSFVFEASLVAPADANVYIDNAPSVWIQSNHITRGKAPAIRATAIPPPSGFMHTLLYIQANDLDNSESWAIDVDGYWNVHIDDNWSSCGQNTTSSGQIRLQNCKLGYIRNNDVKGALGSASEGIVLVNCSDMKVDGSTVEYMVNGIVLDNCTRVRVSNNTSGQMTGLPPTGLPMQVCFLARNMPMNHGCTWVDNTPVNPTVADYQGIDARDILKSRTISTESAGIARASNMVLSPAASVTPTTNGDLTFQATSNTSLTFKFKGSDGTVRSGSITLS